MPTRRFFTENRRSKIMLDTLFSGVYSASTTTPDVLNFLLCIAV